MFWANAYKFMDANRQLDDLKLKEQIAVIAVFIIIIVFLIPLSVVTLILVALLKESHPTVTRIIVFFYTVIGLPLFGFICYKSVRKASQRMIEEKRRKWGPIQEDSPSKSDQNQSEDYKQSLKDIKSLTVKDGLPTCVKCYKTKDLSEGSYELIYYGNFHSDSPTKSTWTLLGHEEIFICYSCVNSTELERHKLQRISGYGVIIGLLLSVATGFILFPLAVLCMVGWFIGVAYERITRPGGKTKNWNAAWLARKDTIKKNNLGEKIEGWDIQDHQQIFGAD